MIVESLENIRMLYRIRSVVVLYLYLTANPKPVFSSVEDDIWNCNLKQTCMFIHDLVSALGAQFYSSAFLGTFTCFVSITSLRYFFPIDIALVWKTQNDRYQYNYYCVTHLLTTQYSVEDSINRWRNRRSQRCCR